MLLTINTTPKNTSGIYKINYPDGKIYIGQAIKAAKWCNISESCIRACANGKQKTAGKHPQTNEPLKWKWIK